MPNHCSNTFHFHGKTSDIAELKQRLIIQRQADDEDYNGESISFDFNGIIPMPDSLNIATCSTAGSHALTLFKLPPDLLLFNKTLRHLPHIVQQLQQRNLSTHALTASRLLHLLQQDETLQAACQFDLTLGQQYYDNICHHGSKDWYDWSIANWGTKWNAYACVIDIDTDDSPLSA